MTLNPLNSQQFGPAGVEGVNFTSDGQLQHQQQISNDMLNYSRPW